jgi:hypothetical protein
MVVHACNPSTWEAEIEGSQVRGQTGLHDEIILKKRKKKKEGERKKQSTDQEKIVSNMPKLGLEFRIYQKLLQFNNGN